MYSNHADQQRLDCTSYVKFLGEACLVFFFSVLYYQISVTYENNLDRAAAAGYAHAGTRATLLRRVNVLLVKKVEELTLYILEQEARIAKLEAELANRSKTRRPR